MSFSISIASKLGPYEVGEGLGLNESRSWAPSKGDPRIPAPVRRGRENEGDVAGSKRFVSGHRVRPVPCYFASRRWWRLTPGRRLRKGFIS